MSEDRRAFFDLAYAAFNAREAETLLAQMTHDVRWPDVAGGRELIGRSAIREYWRAQWAATDPRVQPGELTEVGDDVVVEVAQEVFDLQGEPLVPPATVYHRWSFGAEERVTHMRWYADREDALRG